MPLYDYQCQKSGKIVERLAKIDEEQLPCSCGSDLKRIFTRKFFVAPDFKPYLDENIGDMPTWVKSKKHRRELMKQNGLEEKLGRGWV